MMTIGIVPCGGACRPRRPQPRAWTLPVIGGLRPLLIHTLILALLFVCCDAMLGVISTAEAGEAFFGWIYTADIHPPGTFEYEHRSFLQRSQSRGQYAYLQNSEELELGVTPNLQVAGYLNWSYRNALRNGIDGTTGGPGVSMFEGPNFNPYSRLSGARFDSASVEVIYQILNPYTDPIGLALYLEPEFGPREWELEWRIIVQKNFLDDKLVVAANLMGRHENERYSDRTTNRESPLDVTLGASYRVADNWFLGIEGRVHNEFAGILWRSPDHSAFFLGPNVHYATKGWWVTAAWRHQLPMTLAYNRDQADVMWHGRIYGDEHARDEVMLKFGMPF